MPSRLRRIRAELAVVGVPEISVLMSTVAVDAWLTVAVESMLEQRDVSLEVVLVLDGASPPSQEPAWMRDRRIRVIALSQRGGLANALCMGAQQSSSEFLARMDADDISSPERLAKSQEYLEANVDVCVVGTAASLIDSKGRTVGLSRAPAGGDVRRALVARNQLLHPSVTMRKNRYMEVGGYNPRLRQMEDYDLWLRMGLVGRIAVLPDRLLQYRVHENQMSRAAAPYGEFVSAVSRGQYRLGRAIGMPTGRVLSSVFTWRAAQFARYSGVLKPGYDRASRRARRSHEDGG